MIAPGEERDFLGGRAGDHLFCPFECDDCSFWRLKGRGPNPNSAVDGELQAYIRRANLDAFWSRRPGTVYGLNNLFAEQVAVGERFGFAMFQPLGPFGPGHDSGMRAAIGVLSRSQRPGRHEPKMKFSSARKARAVHTDVFNASARGIEGALVWRSERTRFVATTAPSDSGWFNSFMTGFKARVGERRKQDAALPVGVMVLKQRLLEEEWGEAAAASDLAAQRKTAERASFYLFLYCGSLRGFEGPKVVLDDLRRQIAAPGSILAQRCAAHVGLPLMGRFKARSQEQRTIMIPIAYETASGLQPGLWAERLVSTLDQCGITTGWAFQTPDGDQMRMSDFEDDFYDRLLRIQQIDPSLFTEGTDVLEDFQLSRSHRRGATTRATAAGVSGTDIDWINRWNIGADQDASGPMRVLYSDRVQLINVFLRFSAAL
jgi:hypothetical protein